MEPKQQGDRPGLGGESPVDPAGSQVALALETFSSDYLPKACFDGPTGLVFESPGQGDTNAALVQGYRSIVVKIFEPLGALVEAFEECQVEGEWIRLSVGGDVRKIHCRIHRGPESTRVELDLAGHGELGQLASSGLIEDRVCPSCGGWLRTPEAGACHSCGAGWSEPAGPHGQS